MLIRLSFKTPDLIDQIDQDLTPEEQFKLDELLSKYVRYGECIEIELDTDAETCTIVPIGS